MPGQKINETLKKFFLLYSRAATGIFITGGQMVVETEAMECFNGLKRSAQLKVIELMEAMEPHPLIEATYCTSAKEWVIRFGKNYKRRYQSKLMTEVVRSRPIAWIPNVSIEWMKANVKGGKDA
jgi:hypothetical protein